MKKKLLLITAFLLSVVTMHAQPDTWTRKADFSGGKRINATGFSIGDKGYIGTGEFGPALKDFWQYDPAINKWTRKADFGGEARTGAVGFSIGNKGYIGTGGYTFYSDFWEYDPAADTWTKRTDFPGGGREFAVGFSIGNKAYVGTGYDGVNYLKDFWEYDPATDVWTKKADFPGAERSRAAAFVISGKGFIGTGFNLTGELRDFWEYDPVADTWTKKADFGGAARYSDIGFSTGGKGYIGMGINTTLATKFYNDIWEYDPLTNNWTQKSDFPSTGRAYATGISIDKKGYAGMGWNMGTYYKDFWQYTPDNITSGIPTITSFSPASGRTSSTVTINGTNFSANANEDVVYFGAVRAVIASATATKLKVYVPVGTTYEPISVTVSGLTAYAAKPFVVTFTGGNNAFTQNSFAPKKDFPLGYNLCGSYVADFDGDGRADIVTGDFNSSTISALRNTSKIGAVSFAQKKNFAAGNGNRGCTAGDLDGDGKPDIVTSNINANTISVLRNTSTAANIMFASKLDFATGNSPGYAVIRDLEGDGKPDITVTNFVSATISVFRNTSSPGNISFEPKKDFVTALGNFNCAISDLDGDGKPDVVVGTEAPSNVFSIFQNTSTPGNISFAPRLDLTTYPERQGIAIGDLDGDGKPDLAIENFNNPDHALSIFRNTSSSGALSFAPKVDYASGGTADFASISDLNGDGKPDIILNNYWSENVSVFKNTGSNGMIAFASKVDYTTGSGPRFINSVDIDGDGKPDIVLGDLFSETISVLRSLVGDNGCTPPSDLNIANITGSSARLMWSLPVVPASSFEIRYRVVGEPTWLYKKADGTQTGITLQNLTPNATYQWEVRGNCGGEITQGVRGPNFTTGNSFTSAGIAGASIAGKFGVYISPNPVTGNLLHLHVSNATAGNYQFSITDMQGRMLIHQNLLLNGSSNKTIDIAALPAGTYLFKLMNNKNEAQQIKFVKSH